MTARTETTEFSIGVVIVNYGVADLVVENLPKLLSELEAFPGSRVYIVDNPKNGCDDAAIFERAIREKNLSTQVVLLAQDENLGFARGNNAGFRYALGEDNPPDYFFMQNPDAYPKPGCFERLISFLEERPDAGCAGPRLEGPDGVVQVSAFRNFSALAELVMTSDVNLLYKMFSGSIVYPPQRDETYVTDWICGAAVMLKRAVLEEAGLFDETYFLYYEETDFMLQAKNAGWLTWYVHDAHAVHYVGQSTGVVSSISEENTSPPYWFQSRRYYFRKNHGVFYAALADVCFILGHYLNAAKTVIAGKSAKNTLSNLNQFYRTRGYPTT